MRKRDERRKFWTALIGRFERSGRSRKEFAAEAGVGLPIFQYWLYKLRRECGATDVQPRPAEVRLVPVTLRPPVRDRVARIEVRMADVRLMVPVGVDPRYVTDLATAFRQARRC